ncbi:hypothetical protein O9992_24525 [Vibrio lentus]|nr:hypothetical protein [Vibrio lentus]
MASYADKSDNERVAIGYMYNQSWNSTLVDLAENDLRNNAALNGVILKISSCFSEDTVIAEVDKTHGENTL